MQFRSSNLKHYKPQPGEKIILCGDNDGKDAQAMQATEKAAAKYRELGVEVKVVVPAAMRRPIGMMFFKEGAEIRRQVGSVAEGDERKRALRRAASAF